VCSIKGILISGNSKKMGDSSDLSRPRVDAQDVKGMLNFRQEARYPDRVGLHPFGTLEKDFAWFSKEKLLPENVRYEIC
jgi:hypothetical protein